MIYPITYKEKNYSIIQVNTIYVLIDNEQLNHFLDYQWRFDGVNVIGKIKNADTEEIYLHDMILNHSYHLNLNRLDNRIANLIVIKQEQSKLLQNTILYSHQIDPYQVPLYVNVYEDYLEFDYKNKYLCDYDTIITLKTQNIRYKVKFEQIKRYIRKIIK